MQEPNMEVVAMIAWSEVEEARSGQCGEGQEGHRHAGARHGGGGHYILE